MSTFPPNNWESSYLEVSYISLTWPENHYWRSKKLKKIEGPQTITINEIDILEYHKIKGIKLLSISKTPLPEISDFLPIPDINKTSIPEWRASIGLSKTGFSSSYQGEIFTFPVKASLISIAPFIQFGEDIENYLLFLSLEKDPKNRKSTIRISDTKNPNKIRHTFEVFNNYQNIIDLNKCEFNESDMPLISCENMTGLPLYISIDTKNKDISIEHSHPGASFVVHGNRWLAQKILKDAWFKKINVNI